MTLKWKEVQCPNCNKTIKIPWKFFKRLISEDAFTTDSFINCKNCSVELEIDTEPSWIWWPDDFNVYTNIERVWATFYDCCIVPG